MSGGPIINPGGGSSSACIDVRFAHSGLNYDLKLGATPLITLSREFLQDGAGTFIGINNKVNLTGQIRPSGTKLGFTELMKREDKLRRLFSYGAGDFEITKEGKPIFSGINAKVVSYSTEKSDNNWVLSMGYSIDLEFYESVKTANNSYRVTSINEAWSLEPIEEHIYTLIATPASNPDPDATGGQTQIENIPQFRLTRKLSAVGVPSSGFYSHFDKQRHNDSEYNFKTINNQTPGSDAYLQAKKWVDDRLKLPFDTSENANARYTTLLSSNTASFGSMFSSFSNLYLYNHTRNINYSITDGSYDVSDSWLALPKSTRFTEDFTIETSTDNKNIRSVRVQGTINGLQITNGQLYGSGMDIPSSGKGEIALTGYQINGETFGSTIAGEKYNNAISGWIYDVKPALYKRACLAINSSDRTQPWYQPNQGLLPPGNPVFRQENALNYIPISTSETHDIFGGTIGYSYEYNNIIKIISGVISESYKINTTGPADHIAEVFVLNRPLGPILQNLATKTSTTKNIEIELVVVPPTSIAGFSFDDPACPVGYNSYIFTQCEGFINAQMPLSTDTNGGIVFRKNDTYGWSPTDGRFSRNVEWLYQPCVKDSHPYQFLK